MQDNLSMLKTIMLSIVIPLITHKIYRSIIKLLILIQIYIRLLTTVEQSCPEIIAIGSVTHIKGFLSIMTLISTFVVQDSKMVQLA